MLQKDFYCLISLPAAKQRERNERDILYDEEEEEQEEETGDISQHILDSIERTINRVNEDADPNIDKT
ncbi:unnamed protein product, partial [Brachionus calyciflorus]